MQIRPLSEGEWITIPDAVISGDTITLHAGVGMLYLEPYTVDASPLIALDTAGVRQLRLACDRWLAAQEEQ